MKRLISLCLTLFCCFCLMLATERRAMAYVDPGSGLLAVQSIGSMLAAAGFFMRRRIMGMLNKNKPAAGVEPRLAESRLGEARIAGRKEDSRNAA
jgi:hypothetical protein